ncbi:hypothetical protein GJAV_G00200840 [Gymnothorax javanicus]|nr:hypothetical protein GJAV_G00200840 [Gymnothorax javanicus]
MWETNIVDGRFPLFACKPLSQRPSKPLAQYLLDCSVLRENRLRHLIITSVRCFLSRHMEVDPVINLRSSDPLLYLNVQLYP